MWGDVQGKYPADAFLQMNPVLEDVEIPLMLSAGLHTGGCQTRPFDNGAKLLSSGFGCQYPNVNEK